jgi:hypothetical protein
VEAAQTERRNTVRHTFITTATDVAMGVSMSRAQSNTAVWETWCQFCHTYNMDELLQTHNDPVPALQLFASHYRSGSASPSKRPVRARTVEQALRSVGQTLAGMGHHDPRLTSTGALDFRLQRQLASYARRDPPPQRVKPIPLPILQHATQLAYAGDTPRATCSADMVIIGFFFLLRPGEYALSPTADEASPFRLCDVHCFLGNRRLDLNHCPLQDLHAITRVGLEFTSQKNAVRGEVIGHSRSGSPTWCPVLALIRRIEHLRQHDAPPTQPLYSYNVNGTWMAVTPTHLTQLLRASVTVLGPRFGVSPEDVSVRSLRSSGCYGLALRQH